MSGSAQCRSCQRPIVWAVFRTSGKNTPIDPEPSPTGNVALIPIGVARGRVVFEAYVVPKSERAQHPKLYHSHFKTCPHAAIHRHRRSRSGSES